MNTNKQIHIVKKNRGRPPKQMASDIEAGYLKDKDALVAKRIAKIDQKETAGKSRHEILAGDFESVKHKYVADLRELSPESPWKWHVDWFYPHAKGGALYIDEPQTLDEMDSLERKKKFLLERGYRYLILSPTQTVFEDLMELENVDTNHRRDQ